MAISLFSGRHRVIHARLYVIERLGCYFDVYRRLLKQILDELIEDNASRNRDVTQVSNVGFVAFPIKYQNGD